MSSFEVKLFLAGSTVMFYGDMIERNTADGDGNPLYHAVCYDVTPDGKVLRRGVINLNPDWTVKSLFWE